MKKTSWTSVVLITAVFAVLAYFAPVVALILLVCGIYDVSRNRGLDAGVVRQYFFGNGTFTWLLSPFNTLLDLLALPYLNRGIYRLEDLPAPYRAEVERLIASAHRENVVEKLHDMATSQARSMFFFKWYGANTESDFGIPAFQERYKYIQTIGVSVFNKKKSTSRHFGPLRGTLRVLYNINRMEDRSAFIRVGNVEHYWQEDPLFIFDDTLLHQSFNETDSVRYCLFVDILRPSLMPPLFKLIVLGIRFFLRGANAVFYKNWKVVKAKA